MKSLLAKKLLLSSMPLKLISLFLGYSVWYICSINQIITISLTVPLCFTSPEHYIIDAPEKIIVTLQGKRSAMYGIDERSLAAHTDITDLLPGKHALSISRDNLFLPDTITIVDYKPINLFIAITDKK
jgi:hypothetical protein